jgi:hypothetical protein
MDLFLDEFIIWQPYGEIIRSSMWVYLEEVGQWGVSLRVSNLCALFLYSIYVLPVCHKVLMTLCHMEPQL